MIKKIRYLGESILRKKCRAVETIDASILRIVDELCDTVKAHNGCGLAAPQIGYDLDIFVVTITDRLDKDGEPYYEEPKVYINPKITRFSKDSILLGEGCLSIPGFYEDVKRPREIDVEALDIEGNIFTEKGLNKWRSRCIQHEYDHLNGTLFIDRLTQEQQEKYKNQLTALEMQFRKIR